MVRPEVHVAGGAAKAAGEAGEEAKAGEEPMSEEEIDERALLAKILPSSVFGARALGDAKTSVHPSARPLVHPPAHPPLQARAASATPRR